MSRRIRRACASSSARWSTTPEMCACTYPPPRSSADTTSPVAAFTSGGPPRKIVPCSRTITASSLMPGTYAPPEVLTVGKHFVLRRQERATGIDEVHARQSVLQCHLLGAQVLLHGDGVVGATLHRGIVRDDHAQAPRHPTDARDDPRGGCFTAVHAVGCERRQLEER